MVRTPANEANLPELIMTPPPLDRGFRRSLAVWGLIIGGGLLYAINSWVPDKRAMFAFLAILLYEAYTLVDASKGNTLSEAMWYLARRPLVPLLFGVAMGMAIGGGVIDPFSAAIGIIYGHFFWQAYTEPREE